ncbi:MAG: bifunctional demethylmenaquinone methyltransferase/2-methoxy-6-polyprenyl-1,4-benzoquinol methylase UbiE [Verrucomicrobia bacterium]|nr:bifunctional demethylmenaquinone methyltransferase/2-methoxy-6-polyprenyl-1,4-benzoquinol methylase UbiE [Verrucomicrobiota bacterium]
MFDRISPSYDRLNRLLSLGFDLSWRRKILKYLPNSKTLTLIDLATGSGDQIFALASKHPFGSIQGFDLSEKMLFLALEKAKKKEIPASFQLGSALAIPTDDETADIVTLSFGIRNMTDRKKCLREIHRILKKDGSAYILDFSTPKNPLLKKLHNFYLTTMLPFLGGLLSKDRKSYEYLGSSIQAFPSPTAFATEIEESGFSEIKIIPIQFGIVTLYALKK